MKSKEIVVKESLQLFRRYGVKSMTIDRLLNELNMSRRALYGMFDGKEELLSECLNLNYREEIEEGQKMIEESEDVIDALLKSGQMVLDREFNQNPNFYYDILHYYPELRSKAIQNQDDFNRKGAVELISRGIHDGLFDENLNPKLVSEVLILMYETLLQKDVDKKLGYSKHNLIHEAMFPYLKGICTPAGLKKLKKHSEYAESL